jgi:uncharacterized NAD(P)/FAD-binding protein YdhS
MEYATQTLEIEIARLRKALREFHSSSFTYEDVNDGFLADFRSMESNIKELERAIEILEDHREEFLTSRPHTSTPH